MRSTPIPQPRAVNPHIEHLFDVFRGSTRTAVMSGALALHATYPLKGRNATGDTTTPLVGSHGYQSGPFKNNENG
ncbi:hypothetical protein HAH_4100 [Haloarcula hispanica ATCC 33960]|uniref:Uncharacterized protein n=1 Tax=Haloarcula hispanica (strain ATCC 33960 / DSM 4426 / JCM 8911 / NBRC 102182 / NCIMB 2187 / VKM B-1755) TaxID=634497 RepID=G0HZI0_HALHT|nr:hypothetical protein HAH_4100 [Haloarcula hispanica ATCC 33960]